MVNFAPGELALPIHRILWAPSNAAHGDHLHVEGPHVSGTLANCTSKWTEAITTIRGALDGHFGEGDHYQVWDPDLAWTHMGVYNCRNIANTNTPSQHAFSNAIDIGPYYGVSQQQKFYDFLTRKEDDMMNRQEILDTLGITAAQLGRLVQLDVAAQAERPITIEGAMTRLFKFEKANSFPGGGSASGLQNGDVVKLTRQ